MTETKKMPLGRKLGLFGLVLGTIGMILGAIALAF